MECAVGQKEQRSRNSVTSWRGLTLFLPPLTGFVPPSYFSLSLPLYLCTMFSFSLSFSPSLSLFQAALMLAQVLLLGLFPHSLSQSKAIFLACNNNTHTNRNVWESPSGYLCNLHLNLVRGQEANRPGRVHANRRSWLAAWLRSKILST